MNYKITSILLLVLFISFSFAAAPTVSDITVSNSYTNDLNYFNTPFEIRAVGSGDVNADSLCWYQIATDSTFFAGDWNSDTNICSKTISSLGGTDDFNFMITIQSGTGDANATSNEAFYWLDSNAPSVAGAVTGGIYSKTLTITGTDTATNTGNGSGVKTIYYRINNGAWQTSTSNPLTINQTSTGSYTINYYALDQLDNNGYAFLSSNTFTVQQASDADCATIAWASVVITTLLCFVVINKFLGMAGGTPNVNIMVSMALAVIVGLVIILTFVGGVCVA